MLQMYTLCSELVKMASAKIPEKASMHGSVTPAHFLGFWLTVTLFAGPHTPRLGALDRGRYSPQNQLATNREKSGCWHYRQCILRDYRLQETYTSTQFRTARRYFKVFSRNAALPSPLKLRRSGLQLTHLASLAVLDGITITTPSSALIIPVHTCGTYDWLDVYRASINLDLRAPRSQDSLHDVLERLSPCLRDYTMKTTSPSTRAIQRPLVIAASGNADSFVFPPLPEIAIHYVCLQESPIYESRFTLAEEHEVNTDYS